jgi:TPR repeat protein
MYITRFVIIGATVVLLPASSARAGTWEDCLSAQTRQDYAKAHQLCRPLAEQGDPRAQSSMGFMYSMGLGVPPDYARSLY